MKNKKLLTALLLVTLGTIGLSYSFADDTSSNNNIFREFNRERNELTEEQKLERETIKTIFDKQKSWEELSEEEQTTLDNFKINHPRMWQRWMKWKKWQNIGNFRWIKLTDEEKASLESMTQEEKTKFFETKKLENKLLRESHENVIDKLLAWVSLTEEEEKVRAEIIAKRAENKEQREFREEQRETMKAIFDKVKAWEELTDEEQTLLDEMKNNWNNRWFWRTWRNK